MLCKHYAKCGGNYWDCRHCPDKEIETVYKVCEDCGYEFPTFPGDVRTKCENCLHPIS